MRIWRLFSAGPKPWSRCCVKLNCRLEFVEGLNWARALLLRVELLFRPRLTWVPVVKYFWTVTFERSCLWRSAAVPVTKLLACGVGWGAQLAVLGSGGSRLGTIGPVCVLAFTMTPCRPAEGGGPVTLPGPAATATPTGAANPPARARARVTSAIWRPYRGSWRSR